MTGTQTTRKCYAKDPTQCRYHGKPDLAGAPGKDLAQLQRVRLAADVERAQAKKLQRAHGKTRTALLEERKTDMILEELRQFNFFTDDYADDEAQALKQRFLVKEIDEVTNQRDGYHLHVNRDAEGNIRSAIISQHGSTDKLHDINQTLNTKLAHPTTPANELPQHPIVIIGDREYNVLNIARVLEDDFNADSTQSLQVAENVYKKVFEQDELSRRGPFWDTQQLLWTNFSGGGATTESTVRVFEKLWLTKFIPNDWREKI